MANETFAEDVNTSEWLQDNCSQTHMPEYIKDFVGDKLLDGTLIYYRFPQQTICLVYGEDYPLDKYIEIARKVFDDLGYSGSAYVTHTYWTPPNFSQPSEDVLLQMISGSDDPEDTHTYINSGNSISGFKDIEEICRHSYEGRMGDCLIFLNENTVVRMAEYSISIAVTDKNKREYLKQTILNKKYGFFKELDNNDFILLNYHQGSRAKVTAINLFNDQPMYLERQMNTFAEREVKKLINVLIQSTEASFDFSFKPKSRKMKIFGKEDKTKQGFRIKEFSEASMDALIEAIYYGNITKLKLSDKYGNSIRLSLKTQTIYLTVSREFKVAFIKTLTGLEDVFTVFNVSLDGGYTVFKSEKLSDEDKYRVWDYITPSISELRKATDATDVLFPYETSAAQDINAFLKEFTFGFEDDILVTEYFDLSAVNTLTPMVDFTYSIKTEETDSYYWDHFPEGTLRAFFTKDNELIRELLSQCINGESACVRIVNLTTGDIGSFDQNGFWIFPKPEVKRIVEHNEF